MSTLCMCYRLTSSVCNSVARDDQQGLKQCRWPNGPHQVAFGVHLVNTFAENSPTLADGCATEQRRDLLESRGNIVQTYVWPRGELHGRAVVYGHLFMRPSDHLRVETFRKASRVVASAGSRRVRFAHS